jgi:hypothetical protein
MGCRESVVGLSNDEKTRIRIDYRTSISVISRDIITMKNSVKPDTNLIDKKKRTVDYYRTMLYQLDDG